MSNDLLALLSRVCRLCALASYFELTSRSSAKERDVGIARFLYDESSFKKEESVANWLNLISAYKGKPREKPECAFALAVFYISGNYR